MERTIDAIKHKSTINENGCWMWNGAKSGNGYAQLWLSGRRVELAHRASFNIVNGPIGEGMCICHSCDTPSCVNPEHLFQGTIQDNLKDRDSKQRQAKHEKNGNAKLNKEQVSQVRLLFLNGIKQNKIAIKFGVTHQQISHIVNKKNWR